MRLEWDKEGEKLYETGVRDVALYVSDASVSDRDLKYGEGVAWNGVTSVTETPEGAEPNDIYADDRKYLSLLSAEELNSSLAAYTYPDEWKACDGHKKTGAMVVGQQARKQFGLVYKTRIGNDIDDIDYGDKLHILYGCKASPSDREYATINDSPEAIEFSYDITTTKLGETFLKGRKVTELESYAAGSYVIDDDAENPAYVIKGKKYVLATGEEVGATYYSIEIVDLGKPTSLVTINSTDFKTPAEKEKWNELLDALYGGDGADKKPHLLSPRELYDIVGDIGVA